MAPKEGDVATGPSDGEDSTPSSSAFWTRLHTFPMVQSTIQTTMGIYATSKENAYIGKGLGVIEYGVNLASTPVKKVASTIVDKYPAASATAQKLDNLALNCLDSLEKKIPAIHETPTQIVTNVKEGASTAIQSGVTSVKKGASTAIHSGVRRVMKTYPGQKVVNGLDTMITWSETTINENEVKETEPVEGEDQPESKKLGTITVRLRNGAVVPLKLYLHMLKLVKHMLANMAGVRTRVSAMSRKPGTSPPRKWALESRRQVTPRKRLPEQSLVSSLTNSAMKMLGMKKSTEEGVAESLRQSGPDSPNDRLCRSEKRKHDEDESDDESDTDSMNLAAALDHYDSDIDSDYYPGEDLNDDSLEYNSGDTESDLETEGAGLSKKGEPLRQLKGKQDNPSSKTKPPATEELSNQSDTTQT